jgi:hypothetical protein
MDSKELRRRVDVDWAYLRAKTKGEERKALDRQEGAR